MNIEEEGKNIEEEGKRVEEERGKARRCVFVYGNPK